jgi:hypothetical protein
MARRSTTATKTQSAASNQSPINVATVKRPIVDSVTVAPGRSLSSTTQNVIQTEPSVTWIENHAIRYPFPVGDDSTGTLNVIEWRTTGTLTASFLNANALSHTVKLKLDPEDIERIKAFIKTSPDYIEENFRWPFTVDIDTIATFTSKENLAAEFESLYDARGKNPDDVKEDDRISPSQLTVGSKVMVEYTPTTWSRKKVRNEDAFFGYGSTLKLQAILILADRYSFQSPRKRRRMG